MYELIGILVGLIMINVLVSLMVIELIYRCYRLIKEDNYDIREIFQE